ncbi:MAG TPA: hypothetical protein VFG96_07630 [Jiangellaceae bacterium]|nr:hypothetical protein [Jiangellaceae bacterium]
MRRRTRRIAVCAVAGILLSGCAGEDATTQPPVRLTATVIQSNLDLSRGTIRVQVTNQGEAPVEVDDLTLAAPPFPEETSQDRAVILPGRRINFRVSYGEPTCSGQTPTTGPVSASLTADGRAAQVSVNDASDVLRRLLGLSCGRQRLADVVEIDLGETWTPMTGEQALTGSLELQRVGAGPVVTLEKVAGSVAYTLQPVDDADPIATLEPDQASVSVPVRAVALRCDPHARAEGKKNYVFPLWFSLDGGPEIHVEVRGDVGVQGVMDTLCES